MYYCERLALPVDCQDRVTPEASSLCMTEGHCGLVGSKFFIWNSYAGKLLGKNPWSEQAVELQRALTKATNTTVVLQPPVVDTAVHILNVLRSAEADAARATVPESQAPFVAFDDTYVMYAYLLGHQISGGSDHCLLNHDWLTMP